MAGIADKLDEAYGDKPLTELVDAPHGRTARSAGHRGGHVDLGLSTSIVEWVRSYG